MTWTQSLGLAIGCVALIFVTLTVYGRMRWNRLTKDLESRVLADHVAPHSTRYSEAELTGLPEPVQRYFRSVLPDGAPIVTGVTVEHRGTFNMGQATDAWKPFTSRQRVVTRRPGFVWDGRVNMLPSVPVHVHDAYIGGEGILHPAVLGLVSLTKMRGTGSIAEGELLRFFAEAAWYPTALLPSQGVRWEALDATSAKATLCDGPISLTMTFAFAADGLLSTVRVEARGRTVGDSVIPTPWQGRWSNYQRRGGMLVPLTGEVAWMLPEGAKPYWRGTITALQFEFTP